MEGEKAKNCKEEISYQYWLHNIPGVGGRTIEKILEEFGSARKAYFAGPDVLRSMIRGKGKEDLDNFMKSWDVERKYEQLRQKKILFISREDPRYPLRLKLLENPPYAIYCIGHLPEEQIPSAAVVGARECSEYGSSMARAFAGKLAQAGVAVISGMARGIDGIAQQAALEAGGKTYAVLGNGVDVCYPVSNRKLYQEILESGGGILSPFPPGSQPVKRQFPERNRIVAGLSDLLLVVEARLKSGTWITVDMALEQGREVYAVPGRITDRLSDGCNKLVREGALVFLSPRDFMEGLRHSFPEKMACCVAKRTKPAGSPALPPITPEEAVVLEALDLYPQPLERIREQLQVKLTEKGFHSFSKNLLTILMRLCLKGVAKQNSPGWFSLDI